MTSFYTNVRRYGKNILYRGIENNKRVMRRIEYMPTLYVPSKSPTKFRTLRGDYVDEIRPGNMSDCRDFVENYKEVDNFQIFGNTRYEYTFISEEFEHEIIWEKSFFRIANIDIEVGAPPQGGFPEAEKAEGEITAITVRMNGKFTSFGCGDFDPKNPEKIEYIKNLPIEYHKCKNEIDLLRKFIDFWSLDYPDIITGWNTSTFDIPYLVNRITTILGESEAKKLSPWKIINRKIQKSNRGEIATYDIYGISGLDYLTLFKWFSQRGPQENHRLDNIANVVLGERKLDYSEYGDLHNLYKTNFQLYMEYNIHDVYLVDRIDETEGLMDLVLSMSYDNKVLHEDVFAQTRMWDAIVYNALKKKNIVVPPLNPTDKDDKYGGAFVKVPVPGMYNWVASFDLNAMYPMLMIMYGISMETIIEPENWTEEMRELISSGSITVDNLVEKKVDLSVLQKYNVSMTPNRQFFDKSKDGILPELMRTMYDDRSKYKKLMLESKKKLEAAKGDPKQEEFFGKEIARYKNLQLSKKVTLNSAYGAFGSSYFRFFDIRIAEAITYAGQLSIRWIERKLNEYLNGILKTNNVDRVIGVDTDSVYLNLEDLVMEAFQRKLPETEEVINFMDKVCSKKIQPFIDKSYEELREYVNAKEQKMQMKRENLANKTLWKAKKMYIMNVYDSEGVRYSEPDLKMMGIEAVRSSTPFVCREKIKHTIELIMSGTENDVISYIEEVKDELRTVNPEELAFPRSANDLEKYKGDIQSVVKKGCPIQVNGSLFYNHMIKKQALQDKYEYIQDGDKIKFLYLKKPNPISNHTIAFKDKLPEEFGLHRYVDFETQFEKSFLDPVTSLLDCIGWKAQRTATLEDFFS